MKESALSIGAMSRASGLSISALRFYDGAGVLRPVGVDPRSGYRWYAADQVSTARLIASLRRVQMALPEICAVLDVRADPAAAARLLDRHLRRLEDGLTDARRQLVLARRLLEPQEQPMTTLTVLTADLTAAINAVGFAVSRDPELPALGGVLFDYDGAALRLAASDRYRLAVSTISTAQADGPAVQVIAPRSLLDRAAENSLSSDAEIVVRLESGSIGVGDHRFAAVDAVFPDYQRLLEATPAQEVRVSAAELVDRLTTGPTRTLVQNPGNAPHDVSVVVLADDTIGVLDHDHPDAVGFNREFLLEALAAADGDQLVLALDGPITPLVIRDPQRPGDVNLLMPSRLD